MMNKINEWKKTESKEVNEMLRELYFNKIKTEIEKNLEEAFTNNKSFKFEFLLTDEQRKIMNENNHDELERFLENRIDRDFPAVISEVYTTDDSKFVKVKEVKMYMIVNIHFYERYLNID